MAALLPLIAVLLYVFRAGPDPRAGSMFLGEGPFEFRRPVPSAYAVTYRVENRAGDELVISTDRVWVRRPFESRVEGRRGGPPGGRRVSVVVNAFARLGVGDAVLAVAPSSASADRRPDAFVGGAERAGFAQPRERRRVAGRICRVYRINSESDGGALADLSRPPTEYTDACFDEHGLLLEEAMFVDRELLVRRLAVSVDERADPPDDLFRLGNQTVEAQKGGGSVREVERNTRPPGETYWELTEAPEGFQHIGRYATVPPQPGFEDPVARQRVLGFMSDVWVHGVDVFVIEQGGTLGGVDAFPDDSDAPDIRMGALGEGELEYGLRGNTLRVRLGQGRFLRVFGTLSPSRLLDIARALEEREGGELVFLDEQRT